MLMKPGLSTANLSIVLNSASVPLPFNGGSTSKENPRSPLFCLIYSVTVILRYYTQFATKLQQNVLMTKSIRCFHLIYVLFRDRFRLKTCCLMLEETLTFSDNLQTTENSPKGFIK